MLHTLRHLNTVNILRHKVRHMRLTVSLVNRKHRLIGSQKLLRSPLLSVNQRQRVNSKSRPRKLRYLRLPHLGRLNIVLHHVNVLVPIDSPGVGGSWLRCTWTPIWCVSVVGGSRAVPNPHVEHAKGGTLSSGVFIPSMSVRISPRRDLKSPPRLRQPSPLVGLLLIVCLRLALEQPRPVQSQARFLASVPARTDLM